MAEVKLNYVHAYMAKGRTYYYFRKKGFPRVRLPDPSAPEFSAEYDRLLRQAVGDTGPRRAKPDSLGELISAYRASPEYRDKKPKTRQAYDRYLAMLADVDDLPASAMSRQWVLHKRDQLADKPRTANYFIQTVRRLYSFGIDRGIVTHNPAERPKMLKQGGKYRAWADNECEAFENSNPPLPMLRAYMLAVHTGQRQGDVLSMAVNQYNGVEIALTQGKTETPLVIPVRRVLREFLDGQDWGGLLMVTTKTGRAFKADHFRHEFRKALDAAGLHHLHFHGLRHTMGRRLAEADADVKAILGHKTDKMARHYSDTADQARQAWIAIEKLDRR